MTTNNIEAHEQCCIVDGKDFVPHLLGYKGPSTAFTDYNFFLFKNESRYKSVRRLFECTHTLADGSKCGMTTSDMCKVFAHSAVHTKEKHYKCNIDGCGKLFALKGNINRHIKTTHHIEDVMCKTNLGQDNTEGYSLCSVRVITPKC
jgi:hypothetical protein